MAKRQTVFCDNLRSVKSATASDAFPLAHGFMPDQRRDMREDCPSIAWVGKSKKKDNKYLN